MKMPIPLAQGQVTGAVAAMMQPSRPVRKRRKKKAAPKRRTTAKRRTTRRAAPKGRLKKGSPAAKKRMAQLRAMRGKRRRR
jgi:hypothetical protein